jgi:hypothetical protein
MSEYIWDNLSIKELLELEEYIVYTLALEDARSKELTRKKMQYRLFLYELQLYIIKYKKDHLF